MSQDTQTQLPRDFKGIWIAKEIWLDKRLNYFERLLLAEINSLDGEKGCYASNEYLCNFFQERERKIQDALAKLKKIGYIYVESFDGRTRILRTNLNPQPIKSLFSTPDLSVSDTPDLTILCNAPQEENDIHTLYKRKEKGIDDDDGMNASLSSVKMKFLDGKEQTFTKQDLFSFAVTSRSTWTSQDIEYLYLKLETYKKTQISDLKKLCDKILENKSKADRAEKFANKPKTQEKPKPSHEDLPIKPYSNLKTWEEKMKEKESK